MPPPTRARRTIKNPPERLRKTSAYKSAERAHLFDKTGKRNGTAFGVFYRELLAFFERQTQTYKRHCNPMVFFAFNRTAVQGKGAVRQTVFRYRRPSAYR